MNEDDLIAAGFERLDPKLITKRPPRIKWGTIYQKWPEDRKLEYLEKLASSMNHAAHLIQDERNQLGELCEKKEQQLTKMAEAVRTNNEMLQQEVTRMNAERQDYNAEISRLKAEVRALTDADIG